MNLRRFLPARLLRRLPLLVLIIACLMPFTPAPADESAIVVVEDPQLYPAFTTCPQTYWYPFANNRDHIAYLTLNTNNPTHSTNHAEWHPLIPQAGYYQVEAYIAGHNPITWCTGGNRTINQDTTQARYTVHHSYGVTNRTLSQYPLSNQWIVLGEFYFSAGSSGYVSLADLNAETEYSTTISFSAMRFTFTRATRPVVYLPLVHYSDPSGKPPPDAGVIQGQGFDACHLPTVAEMQAWWDHSPYSFYALYIGGIHLPALCVSANAAWVKAVHQQGWSFVPTWVGPQAPCTTYTHRMNADPAVSYTEGRQEAQAASTAAADIGLTNYGLGGTVIYYDMENFSGASPQCRQAAVSFMTGWDERLRELGNIAGGYGAHNSYIEDWALIDNPPSDIWVASWYANGYDPYASVNGITWLNGLWINHQRIRQYAGDHGENWGGVGLGIDSDVADGVVAMPTSKPLAIPIINSTPPIEDSGWLSARQGWLVSGNRLYWTDDQGETWVDISPALTNLAYFLPSGQSWALSSPNDEALRLFNSSDRGKTWTSVNLNLPFYNGIPIQLQFTSANTGWMVVKKMTSQAFSIASLMKTTDGGLTWQSYDLPMAGQVSFTSPEQGWLMGSTAEQFFQTTDGGHTWVPAERSGYSISRSTFPDGKTSSGWETSTTGWAATSQGRCTGDKATPGFTCQVDRLLWQTLDGGQSWSAIPLPVSNPNKH
jgi:photosystem II stability/assembly factor-like uncharacterized protein